MTEFEQHIALILAADPSTPEATARFTAWQEGPEGLARRQRELRRSAEPNTYAADGDRT